jgi:5-methylcytosine-specific restriction endonuclease McrBC regulatory subunit McrC
MCKILLLNKMSNFSYGSSDSFCFLFPTEVLFEGFVGGYISSFLSEEANVKLQESSSRLVDKVIYEGKEFDGGFTLRHDIFIEKSDKLFILDTKYKELPRFNPQNPSHKFEYESNVSQTDLYQMYAYASKRGINDVYLLYPLYKGEEDQSEVKLITSNVISKLELENPITIHVLRIPFVFEDGLESETKERLNKIITDII